MSDTFDLYMKKFNRNVNLFYNSYEIFRKDNCNRQNSLQWSVYTQYPDELFDTLIDVIHCAVLVYDNSPRGFQITKKQKDFIGAIKHIDNIIKHTKNPPTMGTFITSTPKLSSTILKVTVLPKFIMNAELTSLWNDISTIPVETEKGDFTYQRRNYNQYLKGKELTTTIKELENIINVVYSFSTPNI